MYETFDHTADLGLRIRAADLPSLFEEGAQALFSCIVDELVSVHESDEVAFEITEPETELLFFDWLNHLLLYFETEQILFRRFEVKLNGTVMNAKAWGEPLDESRHSLSHEVKAITYHGLLVEQQADGWLAEVIVDI